MDTPQMKSKSFIVIQFTKGVATAERKADGSRSIGQQWVNEFANEEQARAFCLQGAKNNHQRSFRLYRSEMMFVAEEPRILEIQEG